MAYIVRWELLVSYKLVIVTKLMQLDSRHGDFYNLANMSMEVNTHISESIILQRRSNLYYLWYQCFLYCPALCLEISSLQYYTVKPSLFPLITWSCARKFYKYTTIQYHIVLYSIDILTCTSSMQWCAFLKVTWLTHSAHFGTHFGYFHKR